MSSQKIFGSHHPVQTTTAVHHEDSSLLHTNLKICQKKKTEVFAKTIETW